MQLLDMPNEIMRLILVEAVEARCVKRALRLRLVNRYFGAEVLQAIYQSSLLIEQPLANGSGSLRPWPVKQNEIILHWLSEASSARAFCLDFYQKFSAHRIRCRNYPSGAPHIADLWESLRTMCENLCSMTGDYNESQLGKYIDNICHFQTYSFAHLLKMQWLVRKRRKLMIPAPLAPDLHVLRAAISNKCFVAASQILQKPGISQLALISSGWEYEYTIFENVAATEALLESLLSSGAEPKYWNFDLAQDRGLFANHKLHTLALKADGRWGHSLDLQANVSKCTAIFLAYCLAHGEATDLRNKLHFFLEVRCTDEILSIVRSELNINTLLSIIAGNVSHNQEREIKLVQYLLDNGATPQDNDLPQQCPMPKPRSSRNISLTDPNPGPWNPLRGAVLAGNEKFVGLLLERGADPNGVDDDVLWQATLSGRMDHVRLLVEAGADTNRIPTGWRDTLRKECQWSHLSLPPILGPLWNAIRLEHKEMCLYLLEHGARASLSTHGHIYLLQAYKQDLESMMEFLVDLGISTEVLKEDYELKRVCLIIGLVLSFIKPFKGFGRTTRLCSLQ